MPPDALLLKCPIDGDSYTVTGIPRSGSSKELMDAFGISARRIREAVEAIVR